MSGAMKFLEKLVAEVIVPETGNELIGVLNGKDGVLIKRHIQKNLAAFSISRLVSYLQTLDLNSWASALVDEIFKALDELSYEKIKELGFSGIVYLCAHLNGKKLHLLLRENESAISIDSTCDLFYAARRADEEHRKSLLAHFRTAYEKLIGGHDLADLKGLLKSENYVKEYLPIILSRAEAIFSNPEFPFEEFASMKKRYANYPKCRVAVLLPIAESCRAKRSKDELVGAKSIVEFLLSPSMTADMFEIEDVRKHFLGLLENEDDPTEIERVFEHGCNQEIPDSIVELVGKRYTTILSSGIDSHQNDLGWFWDRLWNCPFEEQLIILDQPTREVLRKTDAESAWKIASSCWGKEQIEPYRKMARRKYIGWFTPQIVKEHDVGVLNYWITIGKKKTETNVLMRIRELWETLSFDLLLVAFQGKGNVLDKRIGQLKKRMLHEKFPDFTSSEHSRSELVSAYETLRPLNKQEYSYLEKMFKLEFAKMTIEELVHFEKTHQIITDAFWAEFFAVCEKIVQGYLNDPILSPKELIVRAKNLPNGQGNLERCLYAEARKRVAAMHIEQIEDLLEDKTFLADAMANRYRELLPGMFASSSEEELELRYRRCPSELKAEFLKQLVSAAEK